MKADYIKATAILPRCGVVFVCIVRFYHSQQQHQQISSVNKKTHHEMRIPERDVTCYLFT